MKAIFWYFPFILQTLVIGFDEFYYHWKRGLPKWERIGHPIDSLSVVACLAYVLFVPYSHFALVLYIIIAVASCLLVTKDEFVHKEYSPAPEQWLHAVLFINHPLVLISLGWMWAHLAGYRLFLVVQLIFASLFCLYQVIFWNFIWKPEFSPEFPGEPNEKMEKARLERKND